jgi:sarcosine oxidase
MTETADVVVVGLGAVGSATLHRLAKRGVRAVGIDRFHPPHDRGSTHGESRITRLGVGEGVAYAGLVRRSHEIWRELEQESGETLLMQTGGLILGPADGGASHHGQADFVSRSIEVAERHAVPHEVLDSVEIARRYPQLGLHGDERGYFEPSAGLVLPERCVAVQLRLAQALGAAVHTGETVQSVRETPGGVEVVTDRRRLSAGRVVLAAGPWLPGLAGPAVAAHAEVFRQTLHWYPADDPAAYAHERFPIFIWIHGGSPEDYFYGFPSLPGSGAVKVASERYAAAVDPDQTERQVSDAESAGIFARHVAGRLRGVRGVATRAAACLYTVTPDSGFLVDLLPGTSRVTVASACSGHGFKHSAGLGEALASFAADGRAPDVFGSFGLGRFTPSRPPE